MFRKQTNIQVNNPQVTNNIVNITKTTKTINTTGSTDKKDSTDKTEAKQKHSIFKNSIFYVLLTFNISISIVIHNYNNTPSTSPIPIDIILYVILTFSISIIISIVIHNYNNTQKQPPIPINITPEAPTTKPIPISEDYYTETVIHGSKDSIKSDNRPVLSITIPEYLTHFVTDKSQTNTQEITKTTKTYMKIADITHIYYPDAKEYDEIYNKYYMK